MTGTAEADAASNDGSALSNDVIYDVLADQRRRYLLHYLKQQDGPVSVGEVVERIAAWENDKPIAGLTSQERKRVYISLYQSHLPSMDKLGLIDYDEDNRTVELRESLANADIYLEIVPEYDIPWNLYYVGLSMANLTLLVLGWLDVPPFDLVPDLAVGAIILATFAASAIAQTAIDDRKKFGQPGPPPGVTNND